MLLSVISGSTTLSRVTSPTITSRVSSLALLPFHNNGDYSTSRALKGTGLATVQPTNNKDEFYLAFQQQARLDS